MSATDFQSLLLEGAAGSSGGEGHMTESAFKNRLQVWTESILQVGGYPHPVTREHPNCCSTVKLAATALSKVQLDSLAVAAASGQNKGRGSELQQVVVVLQGLSHAVQVSESKRLSGGCDSFVASYQV